MGLYSQDGSISATEVQNTKFVLNLCLDVGLRLLAPFMPFITEELWQRLPRSTGDKDSIHISAYPSEKNFHLELCNHNDIDEKFDFAYSAIKAIRSLRADYKLTPKQATEVFVKTNEKNLPVLKSFEVMIRTLSNASKLAFLSSNSGESFVPGCGVGIVNDECEIGLLLKGIIDVNKEIQKLNKELEKLNNSIKGMEGKMGKESYNKVPEHVKEKDQAKLKSQKLEAEKMGQAIENFKSMA